MQPESPPTNLVLASAFRLRAAELRPFLNSTAILTSRPLIVFFGGDFDDDVLRLLDEHRVQLVPFSSVWSGIHQERNRSYVMAHRFAQFAVRIVSRVFTSPLWNQREQVLNRMLCPLLPHHHARFWHFLELLEQCYPRAQQVLLTDVRDVVFQSDPFEIPRARLQVYEEDRGYTMGTNPYNRNWYSRTFGRRALRRVADFPVVCAGTILGPSADITIHLRKMIRLMVRRPPVPGGDQAVHNHVARFDGGHLEVMPNGTGDILTLSNLGDNDLTYDANGLVLNASGRPFPILHMYDRLPGLKERVLARLGIS